MGRIMKHLRYTTSELKKKCKDKNACVKCVTDKIHIGLPPWGLAKFKETVIDIVEQLKVGKYDSINRGIVLDVRNIKVLSNQFPIYNDSPALHINLLADIYLFVPTVGAVVNGIIKHIAPSHISIVIHRVFNVAIRLHGVKKNNLTVNSEIAVKITKYDLDDFMPYIEGVLDKSIRQITPPPRDNDGDSGISTGEFRKNKRLSGKDSDSSSSDEDSSQINSQFLMNKVPIKKEPVTESSSSSSSESEYSADRKKIIKKEDNSSSDEDKKTIIVKKEEQSSDEEDDEKGKISSSVKREDKGSSSDDSSSSESDNKMSVKKQPFLEVQTKSKETSKSKKAPTPIDATQNKKRKHSESSESSAKKEVTQKSKKRKTSESSEKTSKKNKTSKKSIKKEESSSSDSSEEEPPRPKVSKKKSKTSSIEALINKVKKEKNMANTSIAEPDMSIGNYTAFDSPKLSSTLNGTPLKEKKKKNKY